jgi:hypothetical protein
LDRARCSSSKPCSAPRDGTLGVDQTVAAYLTPTTNMTLPRLGLLLRSENPQDHCIACRAAGSASVLRLSRVLAGVETVLSQTAVPDPPVRPGLRRASSDALTPNVVSVTFGSSWRARGAPATR